MNISTRSRTNITKTLNSVSEGEDKKLYEARRAAKKVGFDSKDVTNENVDTYTEMFFQQLGVSVEECPRDYSFLKSGSKKPEQTPIVTGKHFCLCRQFKFFSTPP